MRVDPLVVPPQDGWRQVILEWCGLLDAYERATVDGGRDDQRDVAYWHCETALTALLTAAAWRAGGAGLVEFATKREYRRATDCGSGHGDAWLRVGPSWYVLEAKMCWTNPTDVAHCLAEARKELSHLPKEDRDYPGLALCYYVPSATKRRGSRGLLEQRAQELIHQIPSACLLLAYRCVEPIPEDAGYEYPGMIAIAERVTWRGVQWPPV